MQLIITEKPSVARDLARVLGAGTRGEGCIRGDGLVLSWCRGHMAELQEPAHYDSAWKRWSFETLPMLPEVFELRARSGARDQWTILRKLLRDRSITEVVNACDAGREGELIFRYAYELAGCTAPVRRLWVASMTDVALRRAWNDLRPGSRYDGLADAARCRSEADWLVGLNGTRAMTCLARKGGGAQLLSVGRVQTPTLAMIVDRDRAIAEFKPEDFWRVEATVQAAPGESGGGGAAEGTPGPSPDPAPAGAPPPPLRWAATFTRLDPGARRPSDKAVLQAAERFSAEAPALQVVAAVQGRTGVVVQAHRREKSDPPPLLYDLTALQRRANQRFGFSAARTLEIAQALYERHKLLTYPRTDSRHLTPDQAATLPAVVRSLGEVPPYARFCAELLDGPFPRPGKRVVDASEVGDHHAILPTGRDPMRASLSADEKRIFDLVARRLIAALMPPARFALTTLVVAVETDAPLPADTPPPLHFQAKGRVRLDPGWQAADPPSSARRGSGRDTLLPLIDRGAQVVIPEARPLPGQTRPPRPHNDASILQSMETAGRQLDDAELKRALRGAGLGTPATRANILQTLIQRGFVTREGRDLRATERGIALIAAVPVEELKSPVLTGRWEARLSSIAEGKGSRASFMSDVQANVARIVSEIADAEPPPAEAREEEQTKSLGDCPVCGMPVRHRRSVYACDTGRGCSFVIWGTVARRKVSAAMVKKLLKTGRAGPYKGFKSKKGKAFQASLRLSEEGRVEFDFGDEEGDAADPLGDCPVCAAPVRRRASTWSCDTGRGCSFVIWQSIAQRPLDDALVRTLLKERSVGPLDGFQSKKGRPFSATLSLNAEGRVEMEFAARVQPYDPTGKPCPACGEGRLIRGRAAWGCGRWREGCRFTVPFEVEGDRLTDAQLRARIES